MRVLIFISGGGQPAGCPHAGHVAFVVNESGRPVGGAVVSYVRIFPVPTALPPQTPTNANPSLGTFLSQKNGGFFFNSLVPGSYRFCAQAPGSDLLNPCEWTGKPPVVNLAPGELQSAIRITMKQGVRLHVRLDDPVQVLSTKSKPAPGNDVRILLSTEKGEFHGMPVVSEDAGGRNHMMLVPDGLPLTLSLRSANLQVNDQNNNDKSGGDTAPVQVTKGAAPQVLRFAVRGK